MDAEERLMVFPCEFPIKAMGPAVPEFYARVTEIVRAYVPDLSEQAVTSRVSRNGRYMSVTCTVVATAREQLEGIYQELSASELVIMAL